MERVSATPPPSPPYLVRWNWRDEGARRILTLLTARNQSEAIAGNMRPIQLALTPNQLRNLGTEMMRAADGLENQRAPRKGLFARFRRQA